MWLSHCLVYSSKHFLLNHIETLNFTSRMCYLSTLLYLQVDEYSKDIYAPCKYDTKFGLYFHSRVLCCGLLTSHWKKICFVFWLLFAFLNAQFVYICWRWIISMIIVGSKLMSILLCGNWLSGVEGYMHSWCTVPNLHTKGRSII